MMVVGYRKNRGFTLVELLVVIAIIALLLSIMMPSLQKARQQAQRIVCSNNLRNVSLAYSAYVMENNSGLLVAAYTDYPQYNMIWSQNTCWWGGADSIQTRWGVKNTNGQLDLYLGIKPKLKTPATQDFGGDPQYKIYQCPSDPKSSYNKFRNKLYYGVWGNSYYYNAYLVKLDTMGKWPAPSQNGKYKRITEVKNTSRSILFTEMSAVDCAGRFDRNNWLPGQNWKWSLHEYPGKPGGRQTGNMVVFVDGHVSFVRFTPGSFWDAEYTFFDGNSF